MTRSYIQGRLRKKELREEKVRLIVRLRDEQHLTFEQIAGQVGIGSNRCGIVYHKEKETRE